MNKKQLLGFAFGGAFGIGIYWLVFRKDPLGFLLSAGGWISGSVIIWLLTRRKR